MDTTSPTAANRSASTVTRREGPGVRVPPPVYFAAAFGIGLALQAWSPVPLPGAAHAALPGVGVALTAAGALINGMAVPTMLRGHGTLNTAAPSEALVTSGPYRFSRNPLYMGLVLLYGGLACIFGVVWALPLLIPLVIYTQAGVIAPEERYLERAFGDAYRAYRSRVRRWL